MIDWIVEGWGSAYSGVALGGSSASAEVGANVTVASDSDRAHEKRTLRIARFEALAPGRLWRESVRKVGQLSHGAFVRIL